MTRQTTSNASKNFESLGLKFRRNISSDSAILLKRCVSTRAFECIDQKLPGVPSWRSTAIFVFCAEGGQGQKDLEMCTSHYIAGDVPSLVIRGRCAMQCFDLPMLC